MLMFIGLYKYKYNLEHMTFTCNRLFLHCGIVTKVKGLRTSSGTETIRKLIQHSEFQLHDTQLHIWPRFSVKSDKPQSHIGKSYTVRNVNHEIWQRLHKHHSWLNKITRTLQVKSAGQEAGHTSTGCHSITGPTHRERHLLAVSRLKTSHVGSWTRVPVQCLYYQQLVAD